MVLQRERDAHEHDVRESVCNEVPHDCEVRQVEQRVAVVEHVEHANVNVFPELERAVDVQVDHVVAPRDLRFERREDAAVDCEARRDNARRCEARLVHAVEVERHLFQATV